MTSAHPDEFDKERYLASTGYHQEAGGRLYLNRANGLDDTWVDRAQENFVRGQVTDGHGERYDKHAQSLSRLLGAGTDAPVVAELAVGIERRAALSRVREKPTDQQPLRLVGKKKKNQGALSKRQQHAKEVAEAVTKKDIEMKLERERRVQELEAVRWYARDNDKPALGNALSQLERTRGHRFHVERVVDPYHEPLRVRLYAMMKIIYHELHALPSNLGRSS
jgi:hypothetical protein